MRKRVSIVQLNGVDVFTLFGIVLVMISIGMILGGRLSFALAILSLAALVDAFDGILARKFGTEREFGRYLDGFVDVLDYLVTPSLFLYLFGFNTWYYVLVLMLFVCCGIIRLSVFNEIGNIKDERNELAYLGMPVFWSAFFLGFIYLATWFVGKSVVFPITAILFGVYALLMIYNSTFFKFRNWKVMLLIILFFTITFSLHGFGLIPLTVKP